MWDFVENYLLKLENYLVNNVGFYSSHEYKYINYPLSRISVMSNEKIFCADGIWGGKYTDFVWSPSSEVINPSSSLIYYSRWALMEHLLFALRYFILH